MRVLMPSTRRLTWYRAPSPENTGQIRDERVGVASPPMSSHARRLLLIGAVLATLLLLPAPAFAATTTFNGALNNDWNTPGNWSDGVPTSDDDVVIPNGKFVTLATGADGVANSVASTAASPSTSAPHDRRRGIDPRRRAARSPAAHVALGATTTWSAGQHQLQRRWRDDADRGRRRAEHHGASVASLNFNGGLWQNAGTVNRTTSATNVSIGHAVRERRRGERQRRDALVRPGRRGGLVQRHVRRATSARSWRSPAGMCSWPARPRGSVGRERRASPPTPSRSRRGRRSTRRRWSSRAGRWRWARTRR